MADSVLSISTPFTMFFPSATDPAEIEASIRALAFTRDPIPGGPEEEMTDWDRDLFEAHFELAKRGHPTAITVFRQLVRKYPKVPSLKNLLYAAYVGAGRKALAETVLRDTCEKHPGYLFGRVNLAWQLIRSGDLERAREWLGGSLHLPDLLPGHSLFHFSELRVFYLAVATLHLKEDRLDAARAILNVLEEILGQDDPGVHALRLDVARHNIKVLHRRFDEDEARAIRVTVPPRPRNPNPGFLPPSLHHPEIDALYRHGFDFPEADLAAILTLPRESLVADLEAVLRDSRERSDFFTEERLPSTDETTTFALHALFLLGEIGAVESLPLVYEVLAEDDEWLEFWFSGMLSMAVWRPILQLVGGRLDEAADWVLAPGRPVFSRRTIAVAVARIALLQPGRREEVIAWFRRVLAVLLEAEPGDGVLDTRFVTDLVNEAMTIRAVELRPLVAAHFEKGRVAIFHVGELDGFDREVALEPRPADLEPLADLAACYAKQVLRLEKLSDLWRADETEGKSDYDDDEEEDFFEPPESDLDRFARQYTSNRKVLPVSTAPKTGRNDPCPCGSGKKFKKCCG